MRLNQFITRFLLPSAVLTFPSSHSSSDCDNTADLAPLQTSSSSARCSNSTHLRHRISNSLGKNDGRPTSHFHTLRGTIDDVLTSEECNFVVDAFPSWKFIAGGGYENSDDGGYENSDDGGGRSYNVDRKGYAGLGLTDLASGHVISNDQYQTFLRLRERVRLETERALNLCPGTLHIDYTHVSQKTEGGMHHPHADNCFHHFAPPQTENTGAAAGGGSSRADSKVIAQCDPNHVHPYPNRVAASILYLNDPRNGGGNYDGGEFYWADLSTGEPAVLVTPKAGRMAFFTAGVENLHGALPVRLGAGDGSGKETTEMREKGDGRRMALALWYVTGEHPAEVIPTFRAEGSFDKTGGDRNVAGAAVAEESVNPPKTLFEIPAIAMKKGGLKLTLWFHLLNQQNNPVDGSWLATQQDDKGVLTMTFKDKTAMFAITLEDNEDRPSSVLVQRHVLNGRKSPSLQYVLHESVILHDLLDELHNLAFGTGDDGAVTKDENRLLRLKSMGDVENARQELPARRQ